MNNKYTYEIDKVYNRIKLMELFRDNNNNRLTAKAVCIECGKEKILRASDLYNLRVNSCMCQNIKHGLHKTKLYSVYHNMKDRCYNNNCHAFKNYGGRGICICDEWVKENGFENFYNWSISNGYQDGLTIDRINNDGNYSIDNCRWITKPLNTSYANKINHRRKAVNGTYYGISPNGEYYIFENASKFAKEHDLNSGCVRKVANKGLKTYKNWKFGFINEK